MTIYTYQNNTIQNLVSRATAAQATLLIPNLQRPYVWKHFEIIELLDSLFKGWPFGTLLLWDLGRILPTQALVPCRGFYKVVDRTTGDNDGITFTPADHPEHFTMVLDGQQRLQSMILALQEGGVRMKLKDQAWKGSKGGAAVKWTAAHLCVDIDFLIRNNIEKNAFGMNVIEPDDFTKILKWVKPIGNDSYGELNRRYSGPLDEFDPEKHIRLSQIYAEAANYQNNEINAMAEVAKKIIIGNGVQNPSNEQTRVIIFLLSKLHALRFTEVRYMQIASQENCTLEVQKRYMSSIVEIFARLNTAGRTLTKEDIIFAWLRQYWPGVDASCATIRESFSGYGSGVSAEDAIKIITHTWGIVARYGKLLTSEELRKPEVLQSMAAWCHLNINKIINATNCILRTSSENGVEYGINYRSINTIIPIVAISTDMLIKAEGVISEQNAINKIKEDVQEYFSDWAHLTQWLGIWSSRTDRAMSDIAQMIASPNDALGDRKTIKWFVSNFIKNHASELKNSIDSFGADSRSTFSSMRGVAYYWLTINPQRKQFYNEEFFGNNFMRRDIDHVLPLNWFAINHNEIRSDVINSLGNALSLPQDINIAKGDALYGDFELFRNNKTRMIEHFSLDENLFSGSTTSDEIIESIEARTRAIKTEITNYIVEKYNLT